VSRLLLSRNIEGGDGAPGVACDFNHPNLVTLLGYSTRPTLRLVQEMMLGGSLDKALHSESWQ
jgi:hypothetical protein